MCVRSFPNSCAPDNNVATYAIWAIVWPACTVAIDISIYIVLYKLFSMHNTRFDKMHDVIISHSVMITCHCYSSVTVSTFFRGRMEKANLIFVYFETCVFFLILDFDKHVFCQFVKTFEKPSGSYKFPVPIRYMPDMA